MLLQMQEKLLSLQFQKAAVPAVFTIKMGPIYSEESVRSSTDPIAVRIGIQFLQRATCKYANARARSIHRRWVSI
jgi:hypothetical protein